MAFRQEQFEIGEKICLGFYQAVILPHRQVCARVFYSVGEAEHYIATLERFNDCAEIITGINHSELVLVEGIEISYAFVERVSSFLQWCEPRQDNTGKFVQTPGFFIFDRLKPQLVVGVGETLRKRLAQIAKGLFALNKRGYFHSVLTQEDIAVDLEGNVRLFNFEPETDPHLSELEKIPYLHNEIIILSELMKEIQNSHVRAHRFTFQSRTNEIDCFSWFLKYPEKDHNTVEFFLEDVSRYVYNSSIFWSDTKKLVYIHQLAYIAKYNKKKLSKAYFLQNFPTWQNDIYNISQPDVLYPFQNHLQACLEHNSTSIAGNSHPKLIKMYQSPEGLATFERNFLEHPNGILPVTASQFISKNEALECLLKLYPCLVVEADIQMFNALRRTAWESLEGPASLRQRSFGHFLWTQAPSAYLAD